MRAAASNRRVARAVVRAAAVKASRAASAGLVRRASWSRGRCRRECEAGGAGRRGRCPPCGDRCHAPAAQLRHRRGGRKLEAGRPRCSSVRRMDSRRAVSRRRPAPTESHRCCRASARVEATGDARRARSRATGQSGRTEGRRQEVIIERSGLNRRMSGGSPPPARDDKELTKHGRASSSPRSRRMQFCDTPRHECPALRQRQQTVSGRARRAGRGDVPDRCRRDAVHHRTLRCRQEHAAQADPSERTAVAGRCGVRRTQPA